MSNNNAAGAVGGVGTRDDYSEPPAMYEQLPDDQGTGSTFI